MVKKAGLVQLFLHDTSGATAIEYALIACGVGATVASTIWGVGAGVKANLYDKLTNMF
jgi:Flp pilus assembly pilin Flp